jgi:hypothetical protein
MTTDNLLQLDEKRMIEIDIMLNRKRDNTKKVYTRE